MFACEIGASMTNFECVCVIQYKCGRFRSKHMRQVFLSLLLICRLLELRNTVACAWIFVSSMVRWRERERDIGGRSASIFQPFSASCRRIEKSSSAQEASCKRRVRARRDEWSKRKLLIVFQIWTTHSQSVLVGNPACSVDHYCQFVNKNKS